MANSVLDLSLDELDRIGREAGRLAVEEAHAAGVPAVGMMRFKLVDGQTISVLAWSHPDGVVEIRDGRLQFLDDQSIEHSAAMKLYGPDRTQQPIDDASDSLIARASAAR